MKYTTGLIAAGALGATIAVGAVAAGATTKPGCSGSTDLTRISKRLDDLQQAIGPLQTQSDKSVSDQASAHANTGRQLADLSRQISDVNNSVAMLGTRTR
jgi:outer membrane murein-binding lipoprotein Lpp